MKSSLILVGAGLFLVLFALTLAPVDLQASVPGLAPKVPAYQLLVNPSMEVYEPSYDQFDGVACQVASGWQRFWYDAPEPCFMDTYVFSHSHLGTGGDPEKIDGDTSQLIVSTEPYTAGLRQQVAGLTPGLGYGFHAAMLTIFQTSYPPAVDRTMFKQVGVDPTGGIDPEAPTVVWCEPDDHDEGPWSIDLRTAVFAKSPTMTVFIRVTSPLESGGLPYMNLSFLDSAILAQTPTVRATSPAVTAAPAFTVNWDNAEAAPDGGYVRWYDVQWMDEAAGVWNDWFIQTDKVEATFEGEEGHTYIFRARAWQRYPNNAHLYGPYRPEGDTTTRVKGQFVGPRLIGTVLSPEGQPLPGATVAISGTTHAATSGSDGRYELNLPPLSDSQTVTVSLVRWTSPEPVYGVTFGPTETVTLTWTLRPIDDVVVNGEFESDLDGWWPVTDTVVAPQGVTEPVHSGLGALALGGTAGLSSTVGVSQTVVLTAAWQPALSFWYVPVTTDTGDLFNVVLTVVTHTLSPTLPLTPVGGSVQPMTAPITAPITTTLAVTTTRLFTPSLDAGAWQHLWYYPGLPDAALTGTVTIRFQVWNDGDDEVTTVYLDEVSLGSTPGDPFKAYVPIVFRLF